jgi:hypothetical protein
VKKEANSAAHALAKAAVFNVLDSIWMEETPPYVSHIIFRSLHDPDFDLRVSDSLIKMIICSKNLLM